MSISWPFPYLNKGHEYTSYTNRIRIWIINVKSWSNPDKFFRTVQDIYFENTFSWKTAETKREISHLIKAVEWHAEFSSTIKATRICVCGQGWRCGEKKENNWDRGRRLTLCLEPLKNHKFCQNMPEADQYNLLKCRIYIISQGNSLRWFGSTNE